MAKNNKKKGNSYERKIADYLSRLWFGDKGHIWRAVSSGNQGAVRNTAPFTGDLIPVTEQALNSPFFSLFTIEVKNRKVYKTITPFTIGTDNPLLKHIKKATDEAKRVNRLPFFIFRANNCRDMVALPFLLSGCKEHVEISRNGESIYLYDLKFAASEIMETEKES